MAEIPNPSQDMAPASQAPTVMQPQVQTQQSFPLQQAQTTEVKPRRNHKRTLYGLGISEVIFGSISVILGIATLIIAADGSYDTWDNPKDFSYYSLTFTWTSQGIWSGLFLIFTGILGMKVKNNPSMRMYNVNMAMSIVTANIMLPFILLSIIAALFVGVYYRYSDYHLGILHIILASVGFIAAIVCIVHSAYCCADICRRRTSYSGPMTYTPQQIQQLVKLANGQHMLAPVHPDVPQCYPIETDPVVPGEAPPGYAVYQNEQGGSL